MKYTNRADLLIAAGESIKMQETSGIEPKCKLRSTITQIRNITIDVHSLSDFEFPLAVVEGKPVFVGDELYDESGNKNIVPFVNSGGIKMTFPVFHHWSWNPPKPKTVIVELLREDAEKFLNCGVETPAWLATISAFRKALEK